MTVLRDKRFILVVCLMAALAANFWAGSRYPALNEKLSMGASTPLSGLAFSTIVTISPDEKLVPRILKETLNWTYTNRQGMTFGILFGALLMTLLALFERRSIRSRLGNTVMGVLVGAPLGVCVNCAAPIAKAVHAVGGRVETMLALMSSSPTLNVIVLTMLFSLFPPYIALTKIALTLVFLLVAVPLLSRLLQTPDSIAFPGSPGRSALQGNASSLPAGAPSRPGTVESWPVALGWVVGRFVANLWLLIKTTVPLMLLAGFLGSVLVTFLPLETLQDLLPASGGMKILLAMAGLAIVGTFLPVPMTFDVIVAAILWQAGLPVQYVIVLLFTLGIFSIFPFFIIWRSIRPVMAASLFVVVAVMGVVAGVAGRELGDWNARRQQQLFFETFGQSAASLQGPRVMRIGGETRREQPDGELVASLQGSALPRQQARVAAAGAITVERIPFQASQGAGGAASGTMFSRLEGIQLGLDEPFSFSALTFFHPYVAFRGVASGDVHNDGWNDLLFTSDSGLSLYANQQGKFVLQRIDIPELKNLHVVNAALVDLDNDGWLDIFFSTYRDGNYVIYNTQGRFTAANLRRLPGHNEVALAGAAAFGDLHRDGRLDVVLGNWVPPCRGFLPCDDVRSNNYLLRNLGTREFQVEQPLPEVPGRQTLSLLLSDFDGDGNLDLVIGNEDPAPDFYYFGNGNGTFRRIAREQGIIPHTTGSTMSIASGDVDNDLRPEMYLGQITTFPAKQESKFVRETGPEICDEIVQPAHRQGCQQIMKVHAGMPGQTKKRDVFKCLSSDAREDYREDCIAHSMLLWAIQYGPRDLCDRFGERWKRFEFICRSAYTEASRPDPKNPRERMYGPHREGWAQSIPLVGTTNVLLAPSPDGRFADKAGEMGVQIAGFTWNAKFADLDNDGFVDLYAVNGWFPERKTQSHIFFRNEEGRRFVENTKEAGLGSFLATTSYTYIDLDNDGDLDIVAVPVAGPVLVYKNNSGKNRVAFELRDHVGNRFGIGSKVVIHYGAGGSRHQMREILASGGFVSFDAPIAYFGLGEFKGVERVEVIWSTGEKSEIRGDFEAGSRYVVTRGPTGRPSVAANR